MTSAGPSAGERDPSDYPAVTSSETAQSLLGTLQGVKDEFRTVEAAVANHLRDGRERAVEAAQQAKSTGALRTAAICSWGSAVAAVAVEELSGSGPGLDGFFTLEMTGFHIGLVSGWIPGIARWHQGARRVKRVTAEADQRCDDFLFAGVAVELALGELRTSLADARGGRPGSAELLAIQAAEAGKAVEHYVSALQALDESDLAIRFPWSAQDVDVEEARAQLAANADAVLAQIEAVSGNVEVEGGLPRPPRAVARDYPTGGLHEIRATAAALRSDLTLAGQRLEQVEDAVSQGSRHGTDEAAVQALERLAELLAEARLYVGFVHADCLGFEAAARLASSANHLQKVIIALCKAPSTTNFRDGFQQYALRVDAAESQLAAVADDTSLRGAHAAMMHLRNDVPWLTTTVNTLATAVDAEPANLTGRAAA